MSDLLPPGGAAVIAAAFRTPREHGWTSWSLRDVVATERALVSASIAPAPSPLRRWFWSCPASGTPTCNLRHGSPGSARSSCPHCHGVGWLLRADAPSAADLVSVYAHGAERVAWAEDVLARNVARDCGVEFSCVAWQVVSPGDARAWPPYQPLALVWVHALDVGIDGSVVLGVRRVLAPDMVAPQRRAA